MIYLNNLCRNFPHVLLTCFICLITTSFAISQKIQSDYVITIENDTIRGSIDNSDIVIIPEKFRFKNGSGETSVYTPDQLFGFYSSTYNEYYKSANVDVDVKPVEARMLETDDRHSHFVKKSLFLKTLIKGKASLYFFSDRQINKEHFFLQMDGGELKELILIRYISSKVKGVVTSEVYKEQLKHTLVGCQKDYTQIPYTISGLKKAIDDYNICLTGSSSFQEVKVSSKVRFYIMGGFSAVNGTAVADRYSTPILVSDIKLSSSSPAFGFGVESFSRKGKFSGALEFLYSNQTFSGSIKDAYYSKSIQVGFSYYRLTALPTIHFKGKLKPLICFGVSFGYAKETSNNMKVTQEYANGTQTMYSGIISTYNSTFLGPTAGAGIEIGNFRPQVRYEIIAVGGNPGKFTTSGFNFLLSYRFGKSVD